MFLQLINCFCSMADGLFDTLVNQPTPPVVPKSEEPEVMTVSQYLSFLTGLVKPHRMVVRGEIGKVDRRGKAVYFTLTDTVDKSVLNCLMWSTQLSSLGINLTDGLEVRVSGYADIYKPYGKLTFQTLRISPVGEGALKQQFEILKQKLQTLGYFDQARKRLIPAFPITIGLITSINGDAKKDFLTFLGNYGYKIYFYDVRVEGINAIDSVVGAITWFNQSEVTPDVLVITRGGGSMESLQAFNSEEVARAIHGSRIPVLSAIGHENDVTICDLVADVRASTPTHAGKLLSHQWSLAADEINAIEQNINSLFKQRIRETADRLKSYETHFVAYYQRTLRHYQENLNSTEQAMLRCFKDMLNHVKKIEYEFVHNYERFINRVKMLKNEMRQMELKLRNESVRWYGWLLKQMTITERYLIQCDPRLKLKQGYSIAKTMDGKVIKSSDEVKQDDIMTVQVFKGIITSKVK